MSESRWEAGRLLRSELLRRSELDQVARRDPASSAEAMDAVDADNVPWLRKVVAEHGWPVRSLVGEDGASAAWLLAQHADRDPGFQRRCLDLMTEAAEHDEASNKELAYLTDRVLLAEGKPQIYGTQMIGRDGQWEPQQLQDPAHVDERRAAVGLEPLADYTAEIERAYGPAAPQQMG